MTLFFSCLCIERVCYRHLEEQVKLLRELEKMQANKLVLGFSMMIVSIAMMIDNSSFKKNLLEDAGMPKEIQPLIFWLALIILR